MDEELRVEALTPETAQVNQVEEGAEATVPEGQPSQTATVEKPNFYSPEEIENLLKQDAEVDTTRLTPEGRLLMKSFQKGFTPKLMERQTLKQELESIRKEMASLKQPATIEEHFDKDPEGTLKYINGEIAKQKTRLDGAEAFEALKQIEELRSVKDNLLLRGITHSQKMGEVSRLSNEVQSEVLRAIPDFSKKEAVLTDFAIRELGYSLDDIRFLTDPANVGKYAAKFVLHVNKTYDIANAKNTAQEKIVKTPPRSEAVGTGAGDEQSATYKAALKKAMETGEWGKVLELKGVLQKLVPGG